MKADRLRRVPVSFNDACEFVDAHHRHHVRPRGYKGCTGVADDTLTLRGVAIVGRPIAKGMGYQRLITYTQKAESGASLRAAGFRVIAERPARRGWDTPSRPRSLRGTENVQRFLWEAS